MSRFLIGLLATLGIALVPAALRAFEVPEPVAVPAEPEAIEVDGAEVDGVEVDGVEVEEPFADGMMPPGWTHAGCISLGGQCLDVFADQSGDLWVCKACGTTRNPGPGKCRRLTAYEIQNALWCA